MFNFDFNLFDDKPSKIVHRRKVMLPFEMFKDILRWSFPRLVAENNDDGKLIGIIPDPRSAGLFILREVPVRHGYRHVVRTEFIYGRDLFERISFEAHVRGYLNPGERFDINPFKPDRRYGWFQLDDVDDHGADGTRSAAEDNEIEPDTNFGIDLGKAPAEPDREPTDDEIAAAWPRYSPEEIDILKSTTATKIVFNEPGDDALADTDQVDRPEEAEQIRSTIEGLQRNIDILKQNPDSMTWDWSSINDLEWEIFNLSCRLILLDRINTPDQSLEQQPFDALESTSQDERPLYHDHDFESYVLTDEEIDAILADSEERREVDEEQDGEDSGEDSGEDGGETDYSNFYIEIGIVEDTLGCFVKESILGFAHKIKENILSL